MALENTSIEEKEIGSELKIELEYSENEKFKYFCNINKIKINKVDYKENIVYYIEISDALLKKFPINEIGKNENYNINIISCVEICRKYVKKERQSIEKSIKCIYNTKYETIMLFY